MNDILQANAEMQKAAAKSEVQNAAFNAYWGGYYSRPKVKLPETLARAFPGIFGRTQGGGIKSENWQESEQALLQIAANFKKKGGVKNGNR